MTEAERLSQSLCVCRQIAATSEWHKARTVMLYEALPDEVSLSFLFEAAAAEGKTVFCPSSAPDVPFPSDSQLASLGIVVVPGRAFTLSGDRIGRGGGWYDRLLARISCPTFGAAFDCQLFPTLPVEPFDVPLQRLFCKTENAMN